MNAPTILESSAIRQAALRLTVDQYHRLSQAAIVPERTELLHGVIVSQITKSPLHTYLVQLLVKLLRAQLADDYHIRQEQPLTFTDSEPEPDLAIVAGMAEDYRERHPGKAALVVEVAIATVELDREKADLYASAGIDEYWLVLPEAKVVERYSEPAASGYRQVDILPINQSVKTASTPEVHVGLRELFDG